VPLFSVIIPVFNRASLICATLDSVLHQNCKNYEIIIIDDGSSDDVKNILSSYLENRSINYFYQSNSGVSAARNKGASLSNGDYLIFLDSDDLVTENWLSDYTAIIIKDNSDIIYCGINRMKENTLIEYTDPTNPFKDGKSFGNVIPGSFCIRKNIFERIGRYDEQLSYGENTELGFRFNKANPTFSFINKPNLVYNLYDNSHGKNARNKMNGIMYTINKHPQLFSENKNMKIRFLSIAGVAALNCKDYKNAQKYFLKSLILNPFQMKNYFRLCLGLIPIVRDIVCDNILRK
jgi:glycosyltransferase involved in cell wall biosynthesis